MIRLGVRLRQVLRSCERYKQLAVISLCELVTRAGSFMMWFSVKGGSCPELRKTFR